MYDVCFVCYNQLSRFFNQFLLKIMHNCIFKLKNVNFNYVYEIMNFHH